MGCLILEYVASRWFISARFVWCELANDVHDWYHPCLPCQCGKIHVMFNFVLKRYLSPSEDFHMFLLSWLVLYHLQGFSYLFTCIDRSSRWPEVLTLTGISALECASKMFLRRISRFGVPDHEQQRNPVQLPLLPTRCQEQHNHCPTSRVQQHGGEVPQAIEEFSTCLTCLFQLVWALALDAFRIEFSYQRRFCHLHCRGSLWFWFSPPSPVSIGILQDENLRSLMSGFCPVPAPHNTPSAAELPEQFPVSLSSCPMIFVRKDGNVPALALYAEPSKVLFGSQVPSPGLN